MAAQQVLADPTGANVVSGSVVLVQASSNPTVTNTPGAIINWQGSSIGTGDTSRFVQQSSGSAVVSRITSVLTPLVGRLVPKAPPAISAVTLPASPVVTAGTATFAQEGATLTVTNTPGAIINWQSFSIGADATTRFVQESTDSSVLNRVTGGDPSQIFGQLASNGRVFLINQSGILVGAGARIDVAGLVASTLNMSDSDFLSGRMVFGNRLGLFAQLFGAAGAPNAAVDNSGTITTPTGGQVYLVGGNVSNSGVITAPNGEILLAAGARVQIGDTSTPGVTIQINADETAQNLGSLIAQSGKIGLVGALVKNSGRINADQVMHGADGRIYLMAKKGVTLDQPGEISALGADGAAGGSVYIRSELGTVTIGGSVSGGAIVIDAPVGDVGGIPSGDNPYQVGVPSAGGAITLSGHGTINTSTGTLTLNGAVLGNSVFPGDAVLSINGATVSAAGTIPGTITIAPEASSP
ncbi:MAG TPA: filamentous hemagglutinin N-terminal domain-containing protein [Burkholderiales bacterium]|nr:filamentous hemagglutinin N-terminal domain-containing protein [Burkholderiales bacterium]